MRRFKIEYEFYSPIRDITIQRVIEGVQFRDGRLAYVTTPREHGGGMAGTTGAPCTTEREIVEATVHVDVGIIPYVFTWIDEEGA